MSIHIFWDRQAPEGILAPVTRILSQLLEMQVEAWESPVLIRHYDRVRRQHNASLILEDMQDIYTRKYGRYDPILLVTEKDLYIPGHDFVFGLARPAANVSIVSTARLGNGYYGRREQDNDLIDRIVKEGAHEVCHLLGLDHCRNPECIMFCPRTLDDLDRKRKYLCPSCSRRLAAVFQADNS